MRFPAEKKFYGVLLPAFVLLLIAITVTVSGIFIPQEYIKKIVDANLNLISVFILLAGLAASGVAAAFLFIINSGTTKNSSGKVEIEMLALAVKSINEFVVITDTDGKILFVNEALKRKFGYTEDQLTGKYFSMLFSVNNPEGIKDEIFTSSLAGGWKGELAGIRKNWEEFPMLLSASVIKNESGKPVALIAVASDITERKESEAKIRNYIEELQISKEILENNASELVELNSKLFESEIQLKELNSNKDKFLSIISHDLRSPFNSLVGLSDLLVTDIDTMSIDEIRSFGEGINKSSKHLLELVDNLLEWSRIQMGKMEYNPSTVKLNDIVDEVLILMHGNAVKKKISIENSTRQRIELYADPTMLSSVLQNLVSNAIKFTRIEGKITISEKEEDNSFLTVSVEDNGVGMPHEAAENLFNIGSNRSTPGTAEERGTGLGLILCRELVEKNGGRIWVESREGEGSKFSFTVPRALA